MKPGKMKLVEQVYMNLLPRFDQESYRKILKDYDVGVSLMCSPHPSLVPIEMAAAGMWTVTNAYANKNFDKLKAISSNFLPSAATVKGVTQGFFAANARVRDFDARAQGAAVNWATTWDLAFPSAVLDRLSEFLWASMENREVEREGVKSGVIRVSRSTSRMLARCGSIIDEVASPSQSPPRPHRLLCCHAYRQRDRVPVPRFHTSIHRR